jgi:hypothetical protein
MAADLSLFPAVPFTLSTGAVWWDPYIGVLARHKLDEHWSLAGYADIGGFGGGFGDRFGGGGFGGGGFRGGGFRGGGFRR